MVLDSSHIYLLTRTVQADGGTCPDLYDLMAAHSCAGNREVVSSTTCLDHECFRLGGGPGVRLADLLNEIRYSDITAIVVVVDDSEAEAMSSAVQVDARIVTLDDGELSLGKLWADDPDALIVLNDEDAYDAFRELVSAGVTSAMPMISLEFVRRMHACGAIASEIVEAVCLQVEADVLAKPDMDAFKAQRKLLHAQSVLQDLALAAAKRRITTSEEDG